MLMDLWITALVKQLCIFLYPDSIIQVQIMRSMPLELPFICLMSAGVLKLACGEVAHH